MEASPGMEFDRLGFRCSFSPKAKRRLRLRNTVCEARWDNYFSRHGGSVAAAAHTRSPELVELVTYHGLDPSHRAIMWPIWSGATALSAAARARGVSYSDILSRVPSELSDAFAKDIEVDLGRTFPEHPMFSPGPSEGGQGDATLGVERLRRILSAYCVLHPEAGYLQSMNFAAAFLCVVLGDEEAAFYTLLALTDNCLQGYYELDMPALRADSAVFEEALKRVAPHIHAHATKLNFEVQFVLPRWLLCGFLHCLPFEVTVRVWDCMMVAGRQAPRVLAQVGLGLILSRADDILACTSFMSIASLFQDIGAKCVDFSELMTLSSSPDCTAVFSPRCVHAMRRAVAGEVDSGAACAACEQAFPSSDMLTLLGGVIGGTSPSAPPSTAPVLPSPGATVPPTPDALSVCLLEGSPDWGAGVPAMPCGQELRQAQEDLPWLGTPVTPSARTATPAINSYTRTVAVCVTPVGDSEHPLSAQAGTGGKTGTPRACRPHTARVPSLLFASTPADDSDGENEEGAPAAKGPVSRKPSARGLPFAALFRKNSVEAATPECAEFQMQVLTPPRLTPQRPK